MDLQDIRLNQLFKADQAALMRMQLWFTGETHARLLKFENQARAIVFNRAGAEGKLDGTRAYLAQVDLLKAWGETFNAWMVLLGKARLEAARLPFGILAAYHEKLVVPVLKKIQEGLQDFVFSPQLKAILDAADRWQADGGVKLSERIWRLDRETRDAITKAIMQGLSEQRSAWDIAGALQELLGADAELPRWTSTRLYKLTKADIASGDRTGLVREAAGRSQGVSYKALRIARTEIQRIHGLATDQQMAAMPWIEQEQVNLSPSHAEADECDDVIAAGENGQGIYPVGTIELPIHPNCLCFKTAVQDLSAFGKNLSNWVRTGQGNPALDRYSAYLGVDLGNSLLDNETAQALGDWIDGSKATIELRMQ